MGAPPVEADLKGSAPSLGSPLLLEAVEELEELALCLSDTIAPPCAELLSSSRDLAGVLPAEALRGEEVS
jgi:hypothetical protein